MNNSPSSPPPVPASAHGQAVVPGVHAHAHPAHVPLRVRSPVLAHLRAVLVAGLLTAIPLFITVYFVSLFYGVVTAYTKGPADWLVDQLAPSFKDQISVEKLKVITVPVFAVLISLFTVYLLGLLGTFLIGRKILAQVENFIENLPLIKGIYGTTKQVMSVFRQGGGGSGFQRVALVEFPRMGTWTVAFVTNTVSDGVTGQKLVCCFIPMTPNPTSGFFQMFPEEQVRNTDWSVDMGIKIVLSGGLLAPTEFAADRTGATVALRPGSSSPLPSEPPVGGDTSASA